MAEEWQEALDVVLGGIANLDERLMSMPPESGRQTSHRLKEANRTVWRIFNRLESDYVLHLYDVAGLLRAIVEKGHLGISELIVQLADNGVIRVNESKLIAYAQAEGIHTDDFLPKEK